MTEVFIFSRFESTTTLGTREGSYELLVLTYPKFIHSATQTKKKQDEKEPITSCLQ